MSDTKTKPIIEDFIKVVAEMVIDKDDLMILDSEETEITEEDEAAEAEWFFIDRDHN